MALLTKAIKGTNDILPAESYKNQFIESTLLDIASNFGFNEIRTPVFEHTELFNRSVGDTTDVVQKEMYTFDDNGGRSISLKPEGTAGAVRAFLEHGLFNEPLPQKLSYITPCYRYEKPQAGRLREFHQFGVECLGAGTPQADAEIISLAQHVFDFFEIKNIKLEINSIGCPTCRQKYHAALKDYFESKKADLCETCLGRLERNPMRILDCKSPVCSAIAKDAPKVLDYICDECRDHFDGVRKYLDAMNIAYTVNPMIVRGLDYYTKTVFEFVSSEIGAQGTVCGGGRYDGLVSQLGGQPLPAAGFGMGIERLMLLMQAQQVRLPDKKPVDLYIAGTDEESDILAARLADELRGDGISVQTDVVGRSLKAQMKFANKIGALYTVVIGSDELANGKAAVKRMSDGETQELNFEEFSEQFMSMCVNNALSELGDGDDFSKFDISSLLGGSL